jgi:hypothetical protein
VTVAVKATINLDIEGPAISRHVYGHFASISDDASTPRHRSGNEPVGRIPDTVR